MRREVSLTSGARDIVKGDLERARGTLADDVGPISHWHRAHSPCGGDLSCGAHQAAAEGEKRGSYVGRTVVEWGKE